MSKAKLLVFGKSNTGKTSLLKDMKNTLVFSFDGKAFPFPMPHYPIPTFTKFSELEESFHIGWQKYIDKVKAEPETVVIDTLSTITNQLENGCGERFKGYDVWNNFKKELNKLCSLIEALSEQANVVVMIHSTTNEIKGTEEETVKGSFKKIGFLAHVNEAIHLEVKGKTRTVHFKDHELARTLLSDIPDKCPVADFDLHDHLQKIIANASSVSEWSLL